MGEILQRMTDDVSRMGNTVHEIVDTMMTGFLQIAAISVVMLLEDWRLALLVIVLMPLSIRLSALVASRSNGYFREMHRQSGRLYTVVEEHYTNYAHHQGLQHGGDGLGAPRGDQPPPGEGGGPGQLPGRRGPAGDCLLQLPGLHPHQPPGWLAGGQPGGGGGHRHDHRPLRPPDRRSSGADRQRHEQHPARHRGGRTRSTPSWTGRRRPPSPVPCRRRTSGAGWSSGT